jgi:hypothetical protein
MKLEDNTLFNRSVKIVVIDDDFSKTKLSFMTFAKILNGKMSREILTKDHAIIEGEGFHIRFMVKPKTGEHVRGMRCDYVINNTQDEHFHKNIAMPMVSMSNFLRS